MLMNIVIKSRIQFVFFFAGFVLLAFTGISMIALVFISALVAYLYYVAINRPAEAVVNTSNDKAINNTSDVFEDEDLF